MVDKIELKKTWDLFVGEDGFTEVRILGKFQYSGYFKSFDNLCAQLEPYTNMDDEQIYFVMNDISSDCYARPQCEKFVKSPKVTTNDSNISKRKFLLLDFDPVRVSQTNSSNEQFELAHKKAQDVFKYLKEKGFGDMVVAISGNGWHVLVPVDIECNEETDKIVKDFYAYMGSIFSDDKVDFDTSVYTRARLTKLYSTHAKKGANIPTNPWRQSKLIYIPKDIIPTPIEKIKELADLLPKEESKPTPNPRYRNNFNANIPFDLVSWLDAHSIVYKRENQGTSTKFVLEYCPWVDTHSDRKKWDSALFLDSDGKITFNCTHSHCKGKTWHDFRTFYEPDAYTKPQYVPVPTYRPQYIAPQKPKYEIKDEIPELGEKWMSMSAIKKIDLTSLEKVKTGFAELDNELDGLFMSEVTIISGSNSAGKSSWLNTLILNIIQQDAKVALWSGELRPDILKTWFQMPACGKRYLQPSKYGNNRYYVPSHIGEKIDAWLDGKFYIYNNVYGTKVEQILHDMEILLKAGVRVFVLDNLMTLDLGFFGGDKNNQQKELVLRVKDFAMTNKVHVILVAHPRKSMAFLRKADISGTADITNAVDNVFIIHRTNTDFIHAISEFYDDRKAGELQRYGNVLVVEKNRMYGVCDLMVGMYYEVESRRFKNTYDEYIHYGWEQEATQSTMPLDDTQSQSQGSGLGQVYYQQERVAQVDGNMPFGAMLDDAPF